MKKHLKRISLVLLSMLIACGGGGGKGSVTITLDDSIQGRVIDDPIPYARVCLDINQNYTCDKNEPKALADNNGYFTLITPNRKGFVIAEGVLGNRRLILFSADIDEYSDTVVVSPLTTLYKLYKDLVKDDYKVKQAIKYFFEKRYNKNLDNLEEIFEDYIEKGDKDLQEIARDIGNEISKIVEQGIYQKLKSPYTFLAAIEGRLNLELIDKLKQQGITQFSIISAKDAMVGKRMYFIHVYSSQGLTIGINGIELRQGDNQEYWCYSRYGFDEKTGCENNDFQPRKYLEWKDLGSGQIEIQHADLERLILRKFVELDLSNTTFKGCDLLRVGCNTCIGNADIQFPQGSKVYALFSVRLEGLKKEEAINRRGWYEDGYKSDLIQLPSKPTTDDLLEHLTFENSYSKPGFYYDRNKDKFLLWNECSKNYDKEVGYEIGRDKDGNPYVIIEGDFGLYKAICGEGYTAIDILIRMNRYIVCKMLPDEENQGSYRVICTRWTKEGFVLDGEGFLDPKEKFFGFNEKAKDAIVRTFKNNCINQ